MFKDFISLRNLTTMIIISATIMFILAFYALIVYDDLSWISLTEIGFGIFLSYFALFSNEALSKSKKIAGSSYISLLIATVTALTFFTYLFTDSVAINGSSLDIHNDLSIRAYAEVAFLIIGIISLACATFITTLFVVRNGEEA